MQIQSHIQNTLPVFKITDSLKEVILFFKNTTFSHVAVTEGKQFLGVLGENDLENFEEDKTISDYRYNLEAFMARKDTSWLDVLEVFARNEANLIPVLDEKNAILGYYDLTDIVAVFINTPFFTDPGGILVVEKGIKDYSFSEVTQIVESNNTKFIGGFITGIRNDVVEITMKIGTEQIN